MNSNEESVEEGNFSQIGKIQQMGGPNSNIKKQSEKQEIKYRSKIREPSFGLGGGEFSSEPTTITKDKIYYEPSKVEYEKTVQTDEKTGMKSVLSIVTNQEFINRLKIIGKFASFIESNLVVN